jgi:AraC family transcriptional regulator, arabinose operon regulatory protein
MIQLPKEFFKNETVHRSLCSDMKNGILSCGFLNKKTAQSSDTNLVFEYYGAFLLLSGQGVYFDKEGNKIELYPGCFVQRIPGKSHSTHVVPDGEWVEFFICFGKQLFETLSNINILDCRKAVLYPGLNLAIIDNFVNFMNSMKSCPEEELPLLLAEAQRIILTIYQMHKKKIKKDEYREIIEEACQIINENSLHRISAKQVSQRLGIGYERFRKLFKDNMGISPGNFIIHTRINTAKSMLIDTNKSIKEIALELGFPDPFTFSKQFKNLVGTSPSEFKRRF